MSIIEDTTVATTPDQVEFVDTPGVSAQLEISQGSVANPFGPKSRSVMEYVTMVPSLAVAEGIDILGSSVGVIDRNDLTNVLKRTSPYIREFHDENHEAVELTAEIGGIFLGAHVGGRMIQGASWLGRLSRGVPGINRMFVNERKIKEAAVRVRKIQRENAAKGMHSLDALQDPVYKSAARQFRKLRATKGLKSGVAAEGVIAATMNESDLVFPEDAEWTTIAAFTAVGVAAPILFESISANYLLRKMAAVNGPLAHAPYNPSQLDITGESMKLLSPEARDSVGNLINANADIRSANLLINAKAIQNVVREESAIDASQKSRLLATATQMELEGLAIWQRIWSSGYKGVVNPNPKLTGSDGISRHLQDIAKKDPTVVTGTAAMRKAPQSFKEMDEVLLQRSDQVDNLRGTADELEAAIATAESARKKTVKSSATKGKIPIAEARNLLGVIRQESTDIETWVPFIVRDGETVPVEEALGYWNRYSDSGNAYPIRGVKLVEGEDRVTYSIENAFDPGSGKNFNLGIDTDFDFILPGKGKTFGDKWKNMTGFQQTAAFAAAEKAIEFQRTRNPGNLIITAKDNWLKLDMAEEVLRRNPNAEVTFKDLTREEAMFQSFRQKSVMWNDFMDREGLNSFIKSEGGFNKTKMREILNLPKASAWERATDLDDTAVELFFNGARQANARDLPLYNLPAVKKELSSIRHFPDAIEFSDNSIDTLGKSFKLGLNEEGQPLESFFMWRRNLRQADYSRESFALAQQARYTDIIQQLRGARGTNMVSSIANHIFGTEDFIQAGQVTGLTEAARTSSIPFLGDTISGGVLTYQVNSFRDVPVLAAAYRTRSQVEKIIRTQTNDIYAGLNIAGEADVALRTETGKSMNNVVSELRSAAHRDSAQFFVQYDNARRFAWNLKSNASKFSSANGQPIYKFPLTSTGPAGDFNRQRWQELFDEPMPDAAFMPLRKGEDVVVDQLAYEGAEIFDKVGKQVLKEQNAVLRTKGLGEIAAKDWHVPPRNFTGKYVRFIVNPSSNGGTVMHTIAANTQAEMNRMLKHPSIQHMLEEKNGLAMSYEQIKEHFKTLDFAWFEMQDANLPLAQLGKGAKGTAASPIIASGTQVIDESISSINQKLNNLARDTVKSMFEPQINYARITSRSVQAQAPATLQHKLFQGRNIFDTYQDVLLGDRALSRDTPVGAAFLQLEDGFNQFMRVLYDRDVEKTAVRVARGQVSRAENKEFTKLKSSMGEFLPFENAVEFAAAKFNVKPPLTLTKASAAVNKLTSALVLRWGEIAHPILNVSGVANTMPVVVNFFAKQAGETAEAYSSRVGNFGHVFSSSMGPMGVLDIAKVSARGTTWGLTNAGQADWRYAQQFGYFDQSVAEIHKTLGNPGKTEDWYHTLADRADEWAGKLSDKSEEFSRAIAHMTGVYMARHMGQMDDIRQVHSFGHHFANQVVGDYLSMNRPQIYQGGAGLPLGLFQTYMFNYFQRMFRYIEQRDLKSATIQMALQGSIYGGITLPGYKFVTEMMMKAQGGDDLDPTDAIYNAYGVDGGDLIMHGTLSNLPKVFGATDGISLYTRGDVNPRIPTSAADFPFGSIVRNVYEGVGRSIDMFREGHAGITSQEMLEILGQTMPNRPLRGMIEMAAGYAVDRRGNVIAEDTLSAMSVVSRAIGLKPLNESKQNDAYFKNRLAQSIDYAKRARLRHSIKAASRGGEIDSSMMTDALEQYLLSGGNPDYFSTGIRDMIMSAQTSRQVQQLIDMTKSGRYDAVQRLYNANTFVENSGD